MGKSLFIAEKPSVAAEFARVLKVPASKSKGCMESDEAIITWCFGHLITMSYPEAYDPKYKKWRIKDLPFIPEEWKYEVIPSAKGQFQTIKRLLHRKDVDTIYVCTDSGREGEYIYRLVAQEAGVRSKKQKRVWIDSQTEDEIRRGIREAKDLSAYDSLADAAYLRAKEDYLIGINFSRLLTLKYGSSIDRYLGKDRHPVRVGRVMSCVLGMVCVKEREIRAFDKTPFYRVTAKAKIGENVIEAEWKNDSGSYFSESRSLYKDSGFLSRDDALSLTAALKARKPAVMNISSVFVKKEKKQPPLLYNLAELQNDCSKMLKLRPDKTLAAVQQLYEARLVTYPRTDARVLSSAVAKEIQKNISGLVSLDFCGGFARKILESKAYSGISRTKYVDDKKITDHYAIIPTGKGTGRLAGQSEICRRIYGLIVRRFLSIFYPPAVYGKASITGTAKAVWGDDKKERSDSGVLLAENALKDSGNGTLKSDGAKDNTDGSVIKPGGVKAGVNDGVAKPDVAKDDTDGSVIKPGGVKADIIEAGASYCAGAAASPECTYETFTAHAKILLEKGYLEVFDSCDDDSRGKEQKNAGAETGADKASVADNKSGADKAYRADNKSGADKACGAESCAYNESGDGAPSGGANSQNPDGAAFWSLLNHLKKNDKISLRGISVKQGETAPPKRYTSGSLILAMENAGSLIEDDELREQIKGSGIGTSATRAEIIKKLKDIKYIAINERTQTVTTTQLGEMIYGVVRASFKSMLNPEFTASWEMGLSRVADGTVSAGEYTKKLNDFITRGFNRVVNLDNAEALERYYNAVAKYYRKSK